MRIAAAFNIPVIQEHAYAGNHVLNVGASWTVRRRIMAVLRASCRVLGIRRRNRGLGNLGADGLATLGLQRYPEALLIQGVMGAAMIFVGALVSTPAAAQAYCVDASGAVVNPVGVDASNTVVCGVGAVATGQNSVAVGLNANAANSNSVVIGKDSRAISPASGAAAGSVAIGHRASVVSATGGTTGVNNGVAIGSGALANNTSAAGSSPVAIGASSNATGSGSQVAIGDMASARGKNAVAIGGNPYSTGTRADADYSMAMGPGAIATADAVNSLAIGGSVNGGAVASAANTLAIGAQSAASGTGASAIGFNAASSGMYSQAIGADATATQAFSIAQGYYAEALGVSSISIGTQARSGQLNGIAVGAGATSIGLGGVAIGDHSTATGDSDVYVGVRAGQGGDIANFRNSGLGELAGNYVTGSDNTAAGATSGSNVIGKGNFAGGAYAGSSVNGNYNIAIGGVGSTCEGGPGGGGGSSGGGGGDPGGRSALGVCAAETEAAGQNVTGDRNVALGNNAGVGITADDTVALGTRSSASQDFAIAIGTDAVAAQLNSIALGTGAEAYGEASISIGKGNIVNGNNSGAIGISAIIAAADSYSVGNNNLLGLDASDTFVLGNNISINVASATALGNATNVTQPNGVALGATSVASIAGGALGYNPTSASAADIAAIQATNSTTLGAVSVGTGAVGGNRQIVNVAAGTADGDAVNVAQLVAVADLAGKGFDLTTGATGSGTANDTSVATIASGELVTYQAGNNMIVTQAGSVVNYALNPALTDLTSVSITGGPTINNTGIDMGSTSITNLAPGVAPTDAVNVSQLDAQKTHYYSVNDNGTPTGNYDNDGAIGINALAAGVNASANGTSAVSMGDGSLADGEYSIAVGNNAEASGEYTLSVGRSAGMGATGGLNVNVGFVAGQGSAGDQNTSVGTASGAVTLGNFNSAFGVGAGQAVTGNFNTSVGGASGLYTTGNSNLASGAGAGVAIQGNGNVSMGVGANSPDVIVDPVTGEVDPGLLVPTGLAVNNTVAIGNSSRANFDDDVALGASSVTAAAVATASGAINGTIYDYAGINPTSTVSVGNVGTERTITNVAAGQVTATSTDAINGSQLYATNSAIEEIATAANAGWNVTAQGVNGTNVAVGSPTGSSVDLNNSDGNINVTKAADSNDVTFGLAADLVIDNSITVGDTIINGDSVSTTNLTVTGDTQLGDNFVVNEGGVYYDGPITENTHIVNKEYVDNSVTGVTNAGLNFTDASGTNIVHKDLGGTLPVIGATSHVATALSAAAATAGTYSSGNIQTFADAATGQIQVQMAEAPKFGNVIINAGGTGQIAGVTAGTAPTDAVNVSQLAAQKTHYYSVNSAITGLGSNYNNDGATGANALAAGVNASASGVRGVAQGFGASANTTDSVAIGSGASVNAPGIITQIDNGIGGIAIGNAAKVTGGSVTYPSLAIGYGAVSAGVSATALGGFASATGPDATAIGTYSKALSYGTAIGFATTASGTNSLAMSRGASAGGSWATSVGAYANAQGAAAVALGSQAIASGSSSIAIGGASGNGNSGLSANATGSVSIAIGYDSLSAGSGSVAVGRGASAAADFSIAQGRRANATALNAVAIGNESTASHAGAVALGNGAMTADAVATASTVINGTTFNYAGIAPTSTVSIGAVGTERTLTNLAAGRVSDTSTDAINGSQLYAVAEWATRGFDLTTGATGSGTALTSAVETIAPGELVTYQAGNNMIVTQTGNVVNYAVNPALTGLTSVSIVGGPTINNAGIDMGNTSITNLSAGVNLTDAVNVSQLNLAIGTANLNFTGNLGGTVNRTNGQTLAINGVGSTAGVYTGANLRTVVDPATGAINIEMADAPEFTSVTTGNTTINNAGLTILGGPSVTNLGINAAGLTITNVAPGVDGTDAVNVDQLTTVSAIASRGFDLTTGATGSGTALTSTVETIAPGELVTYQAGNNMIVTQTGNVVNYALNPALTGLTSVSIVGGPTINNAGIDMGNTKITNLQAGVDLTDAVNVSQLNAAVGNVNLVFAGNSGGNVIRSSGQTLTIQGQATTAGTYSGANLKTVTDPVTGAVNLQIAEAPKFGDVTINDGGSGKITGVTAGTLSATSEDAVNGSQLFAVGSSTASALGGTSTFNAATGVVTAGLTVGTTTYNNVQDALTQVGNTASAGWNSTTAATGTGTVSGTSVANVAPGATVTTTAGNNISIVQVGPNLTIATNPDLISNSLTINGGPVINNLGITMTAGDILNMGGNSITNVGPGVNGTDAVNLNQLSTSFTNVLNTANSYTDTLINGLTFDLEEAKDSANAGTAAAMAMSQVPQAFEPGMGLAGAGISTWRGQHAIAFGFSKASDNGRVIVNATGTVNSRGQGGAAAGVGIQF